MESERKNPMEMVNLLRQGDKEDFLKFWNRVKNPVAAASLIGWEIRHSEGAHSDLLSRRFIQWVSPGCSYLEEEPK